MRASDKNYDLKRWSIPLKKPNEATKSELSQEGATGNTSKMMNDYDKVIEANIVYFTHFCWKLRSLCQKPKGKFIFSQSLLHIIIVENREKEAKADGSL